MAERKDIKYINRDFDSFKNSLTEFSKNYFPETYTDFSPTSPGVMFMEMASYVGDVLSFYIDNQVQENFLQYARQNENLYTLAYMMGYKPKITEAASVEIDIYQQIPSIIDSEGNPTPDYRYTLNFPSNTVVTSNLAQGTSFLIEDSIDFSFSSSSDPTEISVYQIDESNNPQYFLLKKTKKAISSKINSLEFTFGAPEKFSTVEIDNNNIIKILDVFDSDGNQWYEVPYLAQNVIFDSIQTSNDPNFSNDSNTTPNLLRLKNVENRFVSRFKNKTLLELQFGAGVNGQKAEEITPNPNNIGIGLPFGQDKLYTAFSPTSFTSNDTYGTAPSNTTLTVRYLTGGGVSSNVVSNVLTNINTSQAKFNQPNLDATLAQYIFNSITSNNPQAASGGKDGDSIEEIRKNSLNTFQTQLRSVTEQDYLVRALSLPSEFGSIAKVYVENEKPQNLLPGELPSVLNMYVLGYNANKKLTNASSSLKQNLATYLSQYRVINDSLKIKNGFIVNIGVNFNIVTLPQFNNNVVLTNCINELKNYFDIDKWEINQPIYIRDISILLDKIEGVQTVENIEIVNNVGVDLGYSAFAYDIKGATVNNIIYPSLDPCIFEVKNPEVDIKGRIVSF